VKENFSHSNPRDWLKHTLFFLALVVVILVEFRYMSSARLLSDESYNFRQITRFLNGDISLEPEMNVIPGYHALVALALSVAGKTGLFSARFFSAAISYLSILIFYLLSRMITLHASLVKTLLFAFFPLFFPFFTLVYTDLLAMTLVLLAFYLILVRQYNLGGVVGLLSVLARTNNIAWFAFLFVIVYVENYGLGLRALPRSLRRTWVYLLGLALFLVFLVWNGGIALTNKAVQPLFKFTPGNLYFLLFLFAFLFLPLNLANIPAILRLVRKRRWVLPVLLVIFFIYLLTFTNSHPYNQSFPDYYLHNGLLIWATSGLLPKTLFFLPVAFSLLSLAVVRLRERRFYWLYPFTFLSLLPFWLIEPRYAFVPLGLFLLFKKERAAWLDWLTVGLYLPLSLLLTCLMRANLIFI
jgi:alpha-1,2-glucosyltransferase